MTSASSFGVKVPIENSFAFALASLSSVTITHVSEKRSSARHLTARGLVAPEPKKRPKSSYIRFAAELPNQRWQSDFTHYRLTRPDGRAGGTPRS
jgi:transposase InsO family protein